MPVGNMSVNLGCLDAFMAQHLLDRANVSSTYEQVCGKGMPQCVRSCLDGQTGPSGILGNNSLDRPCRQPHPFAVPLGMYCATIPNKQRLEIVFPRPQVTFNPLCCCVRQENHS